MLDQNSFGVDPYVLFNKLEMVVLDSLLDNAGMEDEFEYFALIGRGGSSTPGGSQPSSQTASPARIRARRAMSVKQRPRRREQQLSSDEEQRPRTNSMPVKDKDQLTRVRNFQTSAKGLQNRGDTVKSASGSQGSLASSYSSDENCHRPLSAMASGGSEHSVTENTPATHRILLLGGEGCGKTALTQQFLTSDDVHDDDYLDDGKEKSCSVLLDGVESFLIFMDSDYDKNNYDPSSANAYIVVYSVTDRDSFEEAKGLLKNLRHFEKAKAIILCGNKSDLARKRQVSTEDGKQLASQYDAKFIETSTMLNHKVDHLLCGIVSQIKEQSRKSLKAPKKHSDFKKSIKGLVDKLVSRGNSDKTKVKHSSTLHV